MSVIEHIRRELGEAVEVREAGPSDSLNGLTPQAVAAPLNVNAARDFLRLCAAQKWSLVPRGAGTQWQTGARPSALEIVLSTENLTAVLDHDEGNATITAQAGCSLQSLNQAVAISNQYLPFDAGPRSTLGGLAATNFSNAWRGRYGMARDQITGLDVLLSDGRELKTGAKVVKNVSGYDLPKLFIGSRGSLGLITAVTVRLRPRDEHSALWSRRYASWEDLESALNTLLNGPYQLTVFRVLLRPLTKTLYLQFDGPAAAVDAQVNSLESNEEHHFHTAEIENAVVLRLAIPQTMAITLARQADESGAEEVIWDVAPAVLKVIFGGEVAFDVLASLRKKAEAAGGYAVLEQGPPTWKTTEQVWGSPPGSLALMRKLKAAYDPANIFSPGRFAGGI